MTSFMANQDLLDPVERRARGMALFEEITGKLASPPKTRREETLIDYVFAEVWGRAELGVLSTRDRRLVVLTTLAATYSHDDLERHLYGAIKNDVFTIEELDEWVMQLAVYSGWSVAEKADTMLQEQWELVYSERGLPAPPRPSYEPSSEPEDQEHRKLRGEWYYRLINWFEAPARSVPYFKYGILNFVFSKMWPHPGLTARERRLITFASIGVSDTTLPIDSHVFGALRSGDLSADECREFVLQFAVYAGWPKASYFQMAIEQQIARIDYSDFVPPVDEPTYE